MSKLRLRYQTIEFDNFDVHLRSLRDTQEYRDDGGLAASLGITSSNWALFGVLWDSGLSLAHRMSQFDVAGLRILEVGCGIGLASLVLNQRLANISATDYHPEAGEFLRRNAVLNDGEPIPFTRSNWTEHDEELGLFDLIIGSDLLYERGNAELLSTFIEQHARAKCEVVLVDPGRGQIGRFGRLMLDLGYSDHVLPARDAADAPPILREQTHSYRRG